MQSPKTNIFKVLNETHLGEILTNNSFKLVLVMYSSTTCGPCKKIKPTFVKLSKENQDCFFVYIDVQHYTATNNTYTKGIQHTPSFRFYLDNKNIAEITGSSERILIDTFTNLRNKIQAVKNEVEETSVQKHEQVDKETILEKLEILTYIYKFYVIYNITPKKLGLENHIDELYEELASLKNLTQKQTPPSVVQPIQEQTQEEPQVKIQPQPPQQQPQLYDPSPQPPLLQPTASPPQLIENPTDDIRKKQEKLKQIEELNKMNQLLDIQNLNKINRLKAIQQMKEREEKENN